MGRRQAVRSLPAACLAGAAVLLALSATLPRQHASAADPFLNPGFESWPGSLPANWTLMGSGFSKAAGEGNPGNAVRWAYAAGAPSVQHSAVAVSPGAHLDGSFEISGSGVNAQVKFLYFDDGFSPLTTQNGSITPAGAGWTTATNSNVAPAGSAFVQLALGISGVPGSTALIDNAVLVISDPAPTLTPMPTATPTFTPQPEDTATPTPTASAAAEPTSPGNPSGTHTATPTRTPSPTRTATPTRTPTGTRTPSPAKEATATKTPTPPNVPTAKATNPLATSTPTFSAGSGFGGMLANGDFELVSDGKPAYWEKFGGTMFADGAAARGTYAGCLESDTSSTKWLYQVVPVEAGNWYAAQGSGRLSGGGAVSIRVSWYPSGDGSGSQLVQDESNVSTAPGWSALATGPVQAPPDANSARVRLVLRPDGAATGCWDDAVFAVSEPPTTTPTPPTQATASAAGTTSQASGPSRTPTRTPVRAGPTTVPGTPAPRALFPEGRPGALRLSEVMSDPEPGGRDAAYEWVEMVNISAETVDLAGWAIGDGSDQQALPAFELPSLGYVVVAGASAQFAPDVPVIRVSGGEIGNGLGNDGDYLKLVAPNGEVGDEISYGDNVKVFDPAPAAALRGGTIGVRDPFSDPASENWSTTLKPTPGEPNVFPVKAPPTGAGPERTASPAGDAPVVGSDITDPGSRGTSPVAWVVLVGLASASSALLLNRFGPRAHSLLKRSVGRFLP